MTKFWASAVLLTGFVIGLTASMQSVTAGSEDRKLIYLALWRGCEEACEAFKQFIAESELGAEIITRDADRDKTLLPQYVLEARTLEADLVVTWGTSVTRGLVGTIEQIKDNRFLNEIPVVFMVVADPIGAGIIKSYTRTGRPNVTGTRNRVPEEVNINTIRSYYPKFKRLGVLYNADEKNSLLKIEELGSLSETMGFELVAIQLNLDVNGHPTVASIPTKMQELKEKRVDFVYVGSSSFLRNNQLVFTESALALGIPVLSPYESMVRDSHALLSIAARYEDVGRLAGRQVVRILAEGVSPGDLAVLPVDQFAYVINMDAARRLNLMPPIDILQIAETVK